jgi:hypothetical protein
VPGYHGDGIDLAAIDAIVGSARRTRPIGERPPWLRDEDARAGVAGAPSVFVTNDDWDPPSERRRGPAPRDR